MSNPNCIREENEQQTEVGGCLLKFGVKSFVFQFDVHKHIE